jgi:hypothetical protein
MNNRWTHRFVCGPGSYQRKIGDQFFPELLVYFVKNSQLRPLTFKLVRWEPIYSWMDHKIICTCWKVAGSILDSVTGFFYWPNPSIRTMALRSTQALTEMSTRKLAGGKEQPTRNADNLIAICEATVWKIWESRRLTPLWASTACYRDNLPFFYWTKFQI